MYRCTIPFCLQSMHTVCLLCIGKQPLHSKHWRFFWYSKTISHKSHISGRCLYKIMRLVWSMVSLVSIVSIVFMVFMVALVSIVFMVSAQCPAIFTHWCQYYNFNNTTISIILQFVNNVDPLPNCRHCEQSTDRV